ncbi:Transposon Ty3-I Gag-Pol polyprotein [Vitis vinifera]|uniref:Transposon Ty3-I Gag-Pol polyprotein n=1 Tax=Vitis vinifera TaxID=29760 RepID=A0A438H987_VITVI|nr:Transposon Ty3-I Gag-Pol polyprotein [Vitis vinifera]
MRGVASPGCLDRIWMFLHEVEAIAPSLEFASEGRDPKATHVGFLSVVEYPEWLANVIPVPKKDGKVRVCVDFRDLNKASPKDDFLLPHIDIPKDIEKTSFIIEWGTYYYRVMPFGLKNAEATYQRVATTLFRDMMHQDVKFRLRLNPNKCTFGVTFGKLLGYMVNERVLVPPTPSCPLLLYLSVSDVALGCMLAQLYDSGKERAIYYLSKRMLDYEMRYVTIERYCLALVRFDRSPHEMVDEDVTTMTGLSRWRMYFNGAANHSGYEIRVLLISLIVTTFLDLFVLVFSDQHPTMNNIVEYEACILGLETSLELESRSIPAYCYLIDEAEFDDGLPWYYDIYQFLRLGAYPEATTTKDKRALRQLVARFVICIETLYKQSTDGMLLLCLDRTSANQVMREIHAGVLWGIDIIGKISLKSSCGLEFILVAIDYFTKWVEAASYARLTSSGVASFIKSHIICRCGVPHELILDRGVHFRSFHSHCGLIELLFCSSIGATPYSLVYSMEVVLPVEIEMGSLRVPLEQQIPEVDWAQARLDQLNLLDERRLRAVDHVRAYQRKMTLAFKKRVKPRPLRIGDLVLKGVDLRGRCMVDGSRWKSILRADQRGSTKEELCVVVLSIITFIDDVTSLHVGFERIITPLRVLCFTIILVESYRSSWSYMITPAYGMHTETRTCLLFYHDPPVEPFLSHSVGPIFSDVVMILGCGYLICINFHIIVSVEYMSDLLYVSIESLSSYQDRPDALVAITGAYFLLFSCGDDCFLRDLLQSTLLGREMFIYIDDHSLYDVCRDEPSVEHDLRVEHPLRLMKSLSDPSCGQRVVVALYTRAYPPSLSPCIFISAFRATITSQFRDLEPLSLLSFNVQSHHRFSVLTFRATIASQFRCSGPPLSFSIWPSKPSLLLSVSAFKAIIASQIRRHRVIIASRLRRSKPSSLSVSTFRAIIASQFQRSEPPSLINLKFRTTITSQFRRSKPPSSFPVWCSESLSLLKPSSLPSSDVQSHHPFLVLVFRAIIASQFRRSEPSSLLNFGVQKPSSFSVSAFRAIIVSQFRHSESSSFSSHHRFSDSAFRAIIASQAIIASKFRRSEPSSSLVSVFKTHHRFSVLAFRAIIASPVPAFKATIPFSSTFRAIIASQFRRSEPSSLPNFDVQSHHPFLVSVFRAIIASQFWRSEPPSLPSLAFRAVIASQFWCSKPSSLLRFGIQSHHRFSVSTFRAIIASQFWHSEPSSFSILAFKSHHRFPSLLVRRSELPSLLSFGVQSHHPSQFRHSEPPSSQFRHSEPPSLLSFDVQKPSSPYLRFDVQKPSSSLVSMFRPIIASQFRRSEPSSLPSFNV